MHRHDLDLIAEYASGTLADESKARALVETCSACSDEFERQTAISGMLREVGPATLTEHERAALHRDLWTELRSGAEESPSRRTAWLPRIAFGGAALLLVIVGAFALYSGALGGGDSGATATFNEIGSSLDDAGGEARTEEDAGDGQESLAPAAEGFGDLGEQYADTPFRALAHEVRQGTRTADHSADTDTSKSDCLTAAGLADHVLVAGYEAETELLIAIPADEPREEAPVSFVDPGTCAVVHVER